MSSGAGSDATDGHLLQRAQGSRCALQARHAPLLPAHRAPLRGGVRHPLRRLVQRDRGLGGEQRADHGPAQLRGPRSPVRGPGDAGPGAPRGRIGLRHEAHHLPAGADGARPGVQAMTSPRISALRELAGEAELEKRHFVYEATEQLRRFLEANRDRLREIGPIKLVDDEQDYLVFDPVDQTWTTRLTYQDPADNEWYDEEQMVEAVSEVVELYNLADILSWFGEAARDPLNHLVPADELATPESVGEASDEDWQGGGRGGPEGTDPGRGPPPG